MDTLIAVINPNDQFQIPSLLKANKIKLTYLDLQYEAEA